MVFIFMQKISCNDSPVEDDENNEPKEIQDIDHSYGHFINPV